MRQRPDGELDQETVVLEDLPLVHRPQSGGYRPPMTTERPTIPADLAYLLTTDHIGNVSSLRDDGSIATHLMWLDWDGEHILTSSPVGSRKAENWRTNPQVSVSVVDHYDD